MWWHIVAKEQGIGLRSLPIAIEGDINPLRFLGKSSAQRAGFQSIKVKLQVDSDATQEKLSQWLVAVENRCPVNDNLANPTPISISMNKVRRRSGRMDEWMNGGVEN